MHGQAECRDRLTLMLSSESVAEGYFYGEDSRGRTEISLGNFSLYLAASVHGLAVTVMPSWASQGGGA